MQHDIGMVGLGTMGRNLLLNFADHGFSGAGLAQDQTWADRLTEAAGGRSVHPYLGLKEFVAALKPPRVVIVLVPAGQPVDDVIAELKPLMQSGDLIVDGGNSHFTDTDRRIAALQSSGISFFGMGVSGGEKGARHGPSMMAGGPAATYERMRPMLEAVAARSEDGTICVGLMGSGSSGHYVKMVHNGIEYAMMQAIAETFDLFTRIPGMSRPKLADEFSKWAESSDMGGFLLQITADIFTKKDDDGSWLLDHVVDGAKAKGTGMWTSQDAMNLHVPIPSIDAAVSARDVSAHRDERQAASKLYKSDKGVPNVSPSELRAALGATMMIAYAQGFAQIRTASETYGYGIKMAGAANVWQAGCIIRSAMLPAIRRAFDRNPDLSNLLLDPDIAKWLQDRDSGLRKVVTSAIASRIPTPVLGASLSYLDGCTEARLPAYLIQAQRDTFGAHTYERLDKPGVFHTEWSDR